MKRATKNEKQIKAQEKTSSMDASHYKAARKIEKKKLNQKVASLGAAIAKKEQKVKSGTSAAEKGVTMATE
eukprot:JP441823.1.p2 GENE.JP441823.1~~JP441823.1.p2  ORF type:complete len:71 (+),score=21.28 JP441823.1:1-213(+)